MAQLLRVQNFFLSMDGFGAGEVQSLEAPFGHADRRGGGVARLPADLASWAFATASWPNRTEPGGSRGLDDYIIRDYSRNIGAEIMGPLTLVVVETMANRSSAARLERPHQPKITTLVVVRRCPATSLREVADSRAPLPP